MNASKLMKVTYYDDRNQIRLLCYADTVMWDNKPTPTLTRDWEGGAAHSQRDNVKNESLERTLVLTKSA